MTPVPAYGLERLRTDAEDAGAEVELLDPYLVSEDPIGAAREAALGGRWDRSSRGCRAVTSPIAPSSMPRAPA